MHLKKGYFKKAQNYLNMAVAMDKNDSVALSSLGFILLCQKRIEEATKVLNRSASVDPSNKTTQELLASIKTLSQK